MLQKYSFIPVFSCLLSGLALWSSRVQTTPTVDTSLYSKDKDSFVGVISNRRVLIESLDRIVTYQYYYHSVYGRFTKLVHEIGFSLPRALTDLYDIKVVEASTE